MYHLGMKQTVQQPATRHATARSRPDRHVDERIKPWAAPNAIRRAQRRSTSCRCPRHFSVRRMVPAKSISDHTPGSRGDVPECRRFGSGSTARKRQSRSLPVAHRCLAPEERHGAIELSYGVVVGNSLWRSRLAVPMHIRTCSASSIRPTSTFPSSFRYQSSYGEYITLAGSLQHLNTSTCSSAPFSPHADNRDRERCVRNFGMASKGQVAFAA